MSYQNVSTELVREYLGGLDGPLEGDIVSAIASECVCVCVCVHFSVTALSELASERGWVVAGETVHIRRQEELIKPKKILAKIDIESEREGGKESEGER